MIKIIFFILINVVLISPNFATPQITENTKNPLAEKQAETIHKIKIVVDPKDEEISSDRIERLKKHDRDDLIAQQAMAEATLDQAELAEKSIWINIVSAILLFIALFLNWKANRTSEGALRNARESLENARQKDRHELRAYVYVDSFKTGKAFNLDGSVAGCSLALTWKNYGSTPALKVSSNFQYFEWHNPEFPPWFPFPDMPALWGLNHGQGSHLAQGGTCVIFGGGPIPTSHIEEISKGWRRLFIWGWIKYEDIFGEAHITKFCYRSTSAGFENGDKNSPIIQFTLYPRNNCADDECKNEDSQRLGIPDDLAEKLHTYGNIGWHSWADFQRPSTYERAPDGTPLDSVGRDMYGIKPF